MAGDSKRTKADGDSYYRSSAGSSASPSPRRKVIASGSRNGGDSLSSPSGQGANSAQLTRSTGRTAPTGIAGRATREMSVASTASSAATSVPGDQVTRARRVAHVGAHPGEPKGFLTLVDWARPGEQKPAGRPDGSTVIYPLSEGDFGNGADHAGVDCYFDDAHAPAATATVAAITHDKAMIDSYMSNNARNASYPPTEFTNDDIAGLPFRGRINKWEGSGSSSK